MHAPRVPQQDHLGGQRIREANPRGLDPAQEGPHTLPQQALESYPCVGFGFPL